MQTANRLNNFKAYGALAINQKIAIMRAEGRDVINLGLGDPDVTPPQHELKALIEAVSNPENHHYPSSYPRTPFYEAIASWYNRGYGVDVDPDTEVLYCMGGAEGLFQLPNCLIDPGDTALVSDPGYPSYEPDVKIAGGKVEYYPLLKENNFVPDLDAIPTSVAQKAKAIIVNLPNNPTAAIADDEFFIKLINWAKKFDVWVISDNPYMDICFDGYNTMRTLEMLEV